MSIVEFTGVQVYANDLANLAGFGIDTPIPGSRYRAQGVAIKGWVVNGRRRAVAVEVTGIGGTVRLPLGGLRPDLAADFPGVVAADLAGGFAELVDFDAADDLFQVKIAAVLDNDGRVPIAWAVGRRIPLPTLPSPASKPDAESEPAIRSSVVVPPSSSGHPTVSVVIPVHNQAALTDACLRTILADGNVRTPFEVIVVDDASSDDTPEVLRRFGGSIQVARLSPNAGFGVACNVGAGLARGDFVVFLNNDTEPLPGWLDAMVEAATARPEAGAVGARLLYPDGSIQHAGVSIGADGYPHHLYAGFPGDHPAVVRSRSMNVVTAACMLVRADQFRSLAGFDPVYRNGWEDADYCLRLRAAGFGVWYCAESVVVHHESASRNPHGEREERNRGVWADRWLGTVEPDCFKFWLDDGLLTVDTIGPLYPQRFRFSKDLVVAEAMFPADAATPAAKTPDAGQPPEAEAEPLPIIGRVETPSSDPGVIAGPAIPIAGWAISPAGISGVEASIDGQSKGSLDYGLLRPDVVALYPEFARHEACGFTGAAPIFDLADGDHRLEIRIAANDGREVRIGADFRIDHGRAWSTMELHGDQPTAGQTVDGRTGLLVAGWAIAAAGIAGIEAEIDGEPLGTLQHGSHRPDVARSRPFQPGADRSGFSGLIQISHLLPGDHRLAILATSDDGQVETVEIPFVVAVDGADAAPMGSDAAP